MSPRSIRGIFHAAPWSPVVLDAAPQSVQDAHTRYEAACAAYSDATRNLTGVLDQLRDAGQDDQDAAVAALAAGQPMPSSVRPAREKAEADARTMEAATSRLAVEAERELERAALACADEWRASIRATADTAYSDALRALDHAGQAVKDAADAAAALGWSIAGFPGSPPRGSVDVSYEMRQARQALDAESPDAIERRVRSRLAPPQPGPPQTNDGLVLDAAGRRAAG